MTNLSWVARLNASKLVSVTPTITANSAYASGNQLGGVMSLTDTVRVDLNNTGYGNSQLIGVNVLDSDKQNAAIDLWLFSASPTLVSSDHAAFNISAAQMKANCIGAVSIGGSYSAASAVSVSSTAIFNQMLQSTTSLLYAVAVIRAAATYTTTTSLQFQFQFYLD